MIVINSTMAEVGSETKKQMSIDVFVEQCSLLDHDICDALREPLRQVPRNVIERFQSRTQLLETSTILLVELNPKFANDCHHRMALIRAKLVQLEKEDGDDHPSDESGHATGNSGLSQLRHWLHAIDDRLQLVEDRNFHLFSMPALQGKLAELQKLQCEIQADGQRLVSGAQKNLCANFLNSKRTQIRVDSLERRWHGLWLRCLEWICRLEEHMKKVELGLITRSTFDLPGDCSDEPALKRRRFESGTGAFYEDENEASLYSTDDEDIIPFLPSEYEKILDDTSSEFSFEHSDVKEETDIGYSSKHSTHSSSSALDFCSPQLDLEIPEIPIFLEFQSPAEAQKVSDRKSFGSKSSLAVNLSSSNFKEFMEGSMKGSKILPFYDGSVESGLEDDQTVPPGIPPEPSNFSTPKRKKQRPVSLTNGVGSLKLLMQKSHQNSSSLMQDSMYSTASEHRRILKTRRMPPRSMSDGEHLLFMKDLAALKKWHPSLKLVDGGGSSSDTEVEQTPRGRKRLDFTPWEWDDYRPEAHTENGTPDSEVDASMLIEFGADYEQNFGSTSLQECREIIPVQDIGERLPPLGISSDSDSDSEDLRKKIRDSNRLLVGARNALNVTDSFEELSPKAIDLCRQNIKLMEMLLERANPGSFEADRVQSLLNDWTTLLEHLMKRQQLIEAEVTRLAVDMQTLIERFQSQFEERSAVADYKNFKDVRRDMELSEELQTRLIDELNHLAKLELMEGAASAVEELRQYCEAALEDCRNHLQELHELADSWKAKRDTFDEKLHDDRINSRTPMVEKQKTVKLKPRKSKRILSTVWRVMKYSWPLQLCLVLLICLGIYLSQPAACCNQRNNWRYAFGLHVDYILGRPPPS